MCFPPPLLFFFFFTCCGVSVHSSTPGVRAAPSHPPTNQPAQPLLPISGVTSPCGYELLSDTIIDQRSPMPHRCMRCCSSCSRADARKLRANTPLERRDAARVRACECVFSPTQTSVGLSGHYGTPNGKFNSKVYEALQDNLWKLLFYESPFTPG